MLLSNRLASAVWLCAALAGPPAIAAGAIPGATEPTQLLNNLELVKVAADGAVTAQKTVQQYATQLQQYAIQKLNIQGLSALPAGLGPDVDKAHGDLNRYRAALEKLQGSLSQQVSAMEHRFAEARLSGRGWISYATSVAADAASDQRRAIERLQYEETVLQQVGRDYEFARGLQQQIPTAVGQHQSLQMLNAQMNRLITQNAKLLEVISATIPKQAQDDARSAEDATRHFVDRELLRLRREALEQRQRAFGGMRP